jgi:hypothetical protein
MDVTNVRQKIVAGVGGQSFQGLNAPADHDDLTTPDLEGAAAATASVALLRLAYGHNGG